MNDDSAPAANPPQARMRGDLTEGPVMRTLLMFAVPTLASNILQSLNGTINSIWVGRLIGEQALAATANANIVMFLVASAAFGFGMAGTVLIGQRFGARDVDGARRAFGSAVGFAATLMIAIAALGFWLAPELLSLMATPGSAFDLALTYIRLMFVSMPFGMASVILAMGLRGTGDSRTPLIFMGMMVAIDVVLNPLLIAGYGPFPALGIAGSAISTIIASLASFFGTIAYVYAKDLPLRLRGPELAYLKPRRVELDFIVKKGLPMGAQMLVMSAAGIIAVGLVNREGLLMTAAYGAAMQLFTYLQMPAMAIGGAVSAMAAQYIGARRWDRIDEISRAGVIVNLAMTGLLTALLLLFDRPVLGLFLGPDSPAVPLARHIQFISVWSFMLFGVTMIYSATMRAGGAVMVPLLIVAVALYPVRLGFYYATYDWLGSDAIWWSFPVGSVAGVVLAYWFYHYSGWRTKAQAERPRMADEQVQADGMAAGRMTPEI
ncbi:MATE family efflux transporter [Aurantiacibacter luteus]|uniref:Multidrug transporter MatE n=1 Tax=Aurantiacibacter luteus TaxID=1581420 RepID=A0A0G9MSS3_9SPHN|nr:MATE family efflux transporter [Aurantiacibacter luteus]KLE33755.1 multidrug transporter MatE [Aurantiacibacter luteus]